MANKLLKIGDGTDSKHGIEALISGGSRFLRFNGTTQKWEASNDGSTYFDVTGGTPYPSANNTTSTSRSVIPIDIDNPYWVWDKIAFDVYARSTSWFSELGAPPVQGYLTISENQESVIWWDRVKNTAYLTFETGSSSLNMVSSSPIHAQFLDGKIYIIGSEGLDVIDLLLDESYNFNSSGMNRYKGNISSRNSSLGYSSAISTISGVASSAAYDVSVYRDPNGSIDQLSRPKHWWSVASEGGVSVYNPIMGDVFDILSSRHENVAISSDGTLAYMGGGSGVISVMDSITENKADGESWDRQYAFTTTPNLSGTLSNSSSRSLSILPGASAAEEGSNVIYAGLSGVGGGGNARDALNIIHENKNSSDDSGVIFMGQDYSGAYMKGEVVGCWPLQGDGNDIGKNDLDMDNYGPIPFTASGVWGSAPDLTSSSEMYFKRDDDAIFDVGSSMSISCWFNRDIAPGTAQSIVGKWDSSASDKSFLLQVNSSDLLQFSLYTSGQHTVGAVPVGTGKWYHFVATFNGTKLTAYLNGEEVDSTTISLSSVNDSDTSFTIGCSQNDSSNVNFFDGKIQNVCLMKGVMNSREVDYEFRRGLGSLSSTATTKSTIAGDSILTLTTEQQGGFTTVCSGGKAVILDRFAVPVIEHSPSGTLRDACAISTIGSVLPHYAIAANDSFEIVQGIVESRQPKVNSGAISSREIFGPVKFTGRHSLRSYDAIVDPSGNGDYKTVSEALDSGHRDIFLREGTHSPFSVSGDNVTITGANIDVTIDGGSTAHSVDISGSFVTLKNISSQTTPGQGSSYNAFEISGDDCKITQCRVVDSDNHGINITGDDCQVSNCTILDADLNGINSNGPRPSIVGNHINACGNISLYIDNLGDNFNSTGNHIKGSIFINSDAENGLYAGNISDLSVTDNSSTSTVADNQVY